MSTDIAEDICTHPKLASWNDILSGDYCYQCMSCGKGIAIPHATIIERGGESLVGIVGLTFGEGWVKKVQSDPYTAHLFGGK